ncbi:hypothetical protein A2Y26_04785 [candidate division CPR2 bacterium GWD2_39_7]|nr:MAG: hypothetical protein UT60_C0019G0029 [candidate division CPR2 bacterium GW2011_GWD2_39_7]OGB72757.1 MAG: hypothetical protein A2Y26_04785 [candidate division CPR2 bacterium GWD2_39_7]
METFVLSVGAHDRSIREEGVQLILSIKRHNSQQKKEILNFDAFLDQLIAAADLPNNNRFANLFFNKLPLGKAEARKKIMMNIENFKGELSELKQLA